MTIRDIIDAILDSTPGEIIAYPFQFLSELLSFLGPIALSVVALVLGLLVLGGVLGIIGLFFKGVVFILDKIFLR
jgi:hypothetical protein